MITANGQPVIAMRLTMPVRGAWVASIEVAADEPVEGALTLAQDDSVTLSGTAIRSGLLGGRALVEAVGGAGGLLQHVAARSYQRARARTIIEDLLGTVGETLDAGSTSSVLQSQLTYWTRASGRASTALTLLTDALAAGWRVLGSGGVWVGTEAYPVMDEDYVATELDRDHGAGYVLLAPDTIALRPGVTLGDDRIGRVEHAFSREQPLRTTAWLVES